MINLSKGKNETITIRTTTQEKEQLQAIADKERRTLGGMVYNWIIDELERIKNDERIRNRDCIGV